MKTFITSSPRCVITFTAMRPFVGFSNGREMSLCRDPNFPFLPLPLERGIQLLAPWLHLDLPLLTDDINLCIVGDGLKGDMRHSLIDEAVADVSVHGLGTRRGAGDFAFPELAFAGID